MAALLATYYQSVVEMDGLGLEWPLVILHVVALAGSAVNESLMLLLLKMEKHRYSPSS